MATGKKAVVVKKSTTPPAKVQTAAQREQNSSKSDKASFIDVSAEADSNTNPPSVASAQKAKVSSSLHSSGSYLVTETGKDNQITKQYLSSEPK